jgi:hypothetical protein
MVEFTPALEQDRSGTLATAPDLARHFEPFALLEGKLRKGCPEHVEGNLLLPLPLLCSFANMHRNNIRP